MFDAVTSAAGIKAPVLSETVPLTLAFTCANAIVEIDKDTTMTNAFAMAVFICSPL
jgi:hypothetical protein